eukprot:9467908-Pyramimonas_sp.AAC.1
MVLFCLVRGELVPAGGRRRAGQSGSTLRTQDSKRQQETGEGCSSGRPEPHQGALEGTPSRHEQGGFVGVNGGEVDLDVNNIACWHSVPHV